jgi:hypothetical protein
MFFEVEPVTAVTPTVDEIEASLKAALAKPHVRLPERSRFDSTWPKQSVVQAKAGFRSWKSFVRSALHIALIETTEGWHVTVGEGPSAEDVEDITLDAGSTPRHLAEAVLEVASRRTLWRR